MSLTKDYFVNLSITDMRYKSGYCLSNIGMQINPGEIVGILGESGSGKTTIGKLLTAALNEREIENYEISLFDCSLTCTVPGLQGIDILHGSYNNLRGYRKNVQFIYQNHRAALNLNQSIYNTLFEAYRIANPKQQRKNFHNQLVEYSQRIGLITGQVQPKPKINTKTELFEQVPFFKKKNGALSGGQLKRISILKTAMLTPELIVADEPLAGLDASKKGMVLAFFEYLKEQRQSQGKALTQVIISHDVGMIRSYCQRVYVMYGDLQMGRGDIIEVVSDSRILTQKYANDLHPYTRELVSVAGYFEENSEVDPTISGSGKFRNRDQVIHAGGCLYQTRCREVTKECIKPQSLHPSKRFQENLVACHKR